MPCMRMRPKVMTLREAKLTAGSPLGGFLKPGYRYRDGSFYRTEEEARAEEDRIERTTMTGGGGAPYWVCGDFKADDAVPCRCGYVSEFLCDHPMGKGKTCDLPLCEEHAHQIGEELHLCEIHFREFQKKCGADRINPWPPSMP